ncbi:MAG: 7-cyano-7-deazaguanine synthase [Methanomicrobia archaeon]|nr:7-cyano-7-deazaguanine synthase [Methanomicrobia archaeon]MCK4432472.1 7-cyano-7-deazaguanine synthase [Methanomicrobia archaeon]
MEANLLFSGGKDSSLSAFILKKLGYEVKLITITFGYSENWKLAKETSEILGYDHNVIKMDEKILTEGSRIILEEGYPLRGIKYIHREVIEELAKDYKVICDGSRRDDRTPRLELSEIRSLEDKYGVEYISPLQGIGYRTLRYLANKLFIVETYNSSEKKTADYETEVRIFLGDKGKNIFPVHEQTRVLGWRGDAEWQEISHLVKN